MPLTEIEHEYAKRLLEILSREIIMPVANVADMIPCDRVTLHRHLPAIISAYPNIRHIPRRGLCLTLTEQTPMQSQQERNK